MQTGVIIRRNAKCFIPNAYLDLAIAANPHGWGAAIVTDGVLQLNQMDEPMTIDLIQDTMKTFEDSDITFYLGNSDTAISMKNMSPFVLLADEYDEPKLVAFIDGNFPGFAKQDSSHPAEYFFAKDYLIPKFESIVEMVAGDLDKLTEQLKKPFMKKDLLSQSVSRGVITLVASNGASVTFAQTDKASEYPWGWVSDNYGYAVGNGTKPAVEEAPKKKSMFAGKSTVREKAPVSVPPSPAIAEAVKATVTQTAAAPAYKIVKWKPDANASRSQKKDGYKQRIGYLPDGWMSGIEINVYVDQKNKLLTFAETKRLGLAATGLPALNNPKAQHDKDNKDSGTEHIPQTAQPSPPKVSVEILPILSPASREKFKSFISDAKVQKLIADNADMVTDPSKVQGIEEKFAHFSKQAGMKSDEDLMKLPFESFRTMNDADPRMFELWAFNLRNEVLGRRMKTAAKAEVEKVEEVVAPPVKKSMFSKKAA